MNSAATWERTSVTVKGTECWQLGSKRQSTLISGPGSTNPSSSHGGPGDIIVPPRHEAELQQGVFQVLSHFCVIPPFRPIIHSVLGHGVTSTCLFLSLLTFLGPLVISLCSLWISLVKSCRASLCGNGLGIPFSSVRWVGNEVAPTILLSK